MATLKKLSLCLFVWLWLEALGGTVLTCIVWVGLHDLIGHRNWWQIAPYTYGVLGVALIFGIIGGMVSASRKKAKACQA